MKAGWEVKKFEKCIQKIKSTKKIPKKQFLNNGIYPIISQEKDFINGHWNNEIDVLKVEKPIVIFGDHTKIVKLIKFDFVKGADGVVCLLPTYDIDSEFFAYQLQNIKLRDLGYARHYRLLKENDIVIPPLAEQKQIVAILDQAFTAIDQAKANIEQNIKNAKELFQSKLNDIFSQKGDGWVEKTLKEVSLDFGRGKSKTRPRNDKKLFGGKYPFIQTGDIRNANKILKTYSQTYNEIGLIQSKLWMKGTICITIAANIAETAILDFDSCFPDSVIGLVVDPVQADSNYTYYALQHLKSKLKKLGKGSAQDNINLGTFQKVFFPFPSIAKQKQIVKKLDNLSSKTKKIEAMYQNKIVDLEELKKSILQKAFAGELL